MEQEIHPSVFGAEALMETYSDNIILFGPDALAQLGEELFLSDRKTILLVMGGASARIPLRMILGSPVFRKPGLNMPRHENVPPEPDTECVRAIVRTMEREQPDAVLAVGGGSVMDAAKAAYLSWQTGLDIDDLFGVNVASTRFPERKFQRICAMPTTAGTGSEVTPYSNIIDARTGVKKLLMDPVIIPEAAAVIPELTLTAPEKLTRETGFDALVHSIESFLNFKAMAAHPEAEPWAPEAIRLIVRALRTPQPRRHRGENASFRRGDSCGHGDPHLPDLPAASAELLVLRQSVARRRRRRPAPALLAVLSCGTRSARTHDASCSVLPRQYTGRGN